MSLLRNRLLTRPGWLVLIVFVLLCGGIADVFAEEQAGAARSPIKITSDQLEADKKSGLVKFMGNVVAVHEDATIMSKTLTVYYDSNNNMKKIDAVGDVRINQQDRVGTCKKATFFPGEKKIIMSGDPRLWREDGIISGSLITIYIDSDKMDVDDAVFNMRPQNSKNETPPAGNGKEN
ncbi:MAG: LptA/OstA family protein [Deltaproteobacteria bacterium]|nr:LptA/OstA family protein [Deltaproteobacteria bacterium]